MMGWVIIVLATGSAGVYDDTFSQGNAAYERGAYAEAIDKYEQLAAEGIASPEVFLNLGNAYYRAQQIGPAIANYERALQLDPGFEAARENLDKSIRETERQLPRPLPPDWEQSLLFWHYNMTQRATRLLALFFWLACWGALGLRLVRPVRRLGMVAFVAGVLAAAFGGSAWVKAHGDLYAVANTDRVAVHYGTSDTETVRFELFAGDRVAVDGRQGDWLRVNTADGERGWARAESFTLVGPPYTRPAVQTLAPKPVDVVAPPAAPVTPSGAQASPAPGTGT